MGQDFPVPKFADVGLLVNLTPAQPVGGRSVRFEVRKRYGGSTVLINKTCSPGISSGITVTNSGQGVLLVSILSVDTSGLSFGAYPYEVELLDTPRTPVADGFLIVGPTTGP